ncbi:hypothetical protein IWZ00DRAFT_368558 [Phyllosticta capitalensis]|uniref:uncharacterized protein n=1 Tax=Phyllosticta capitalensis TaxID=121624 RepID=UPI0031322457
MTTTKTLEVRQTHKVSSERETVEKSNSPRLSLLGLPAEIRNQIWEYVFPVHNGQGAVAPQTSSSSLSLLLTSRQIHAETLLLAYSRTPFATPLCRPSALTQRLTVLSPPQVRAIRSLTFTYAPRTAARTWDGDWRPLLFPVYVQCRKLLWEAVRLLPGVRSVRFVLDGGSGSTKGGAAGGEGAQEAKSVGLTRLGATRRRTVGGVKFFFDTVVGVGLTERSGRGETHAWDERWSVLPGAEGDERAVWLVEEAKSGDDEEFERNKRWVRVEVVRLPLGG